MNTNLTNRVAVILAPNLQSGEHAKIRENLSAVVENIYRRLPSGDYGRGDVRRAVLALLAS